MKNPLIDFIRQVRAERCKELARDFQGAMEESRRVTFTLGHDVVDLSSGELRVIYRAPRKSGASDSQTSKTTKQAS